MVKTKVTLSISEDTWRRYKADCNLGGRIPSYEIEDYMNKKIKKRK